MFRGIPVDLKPEVAGHAVTAVRLRVFPWQFRAFFVRHCCDI